MARPVAKMPLAYLSSKKIKYNVKGTKYILHKIIFKYLCYNMHLFWMVKIEEDLVTYHRRALCNGKEPRIPWAEWDRKAKSY